MSIVHPVSPADIGPESRTRVAVGDGTRDADTRSDRPVGVKPPRRRYGGWAAIAVALVVVGIAGTALAGMAQWSQRDALDPDSAGPQGARALAHVLRDQGVEVVVARDRTAALAALAAGDTTLVLPDSPLLTDEQLRGIAAAATDVVLIDPRARGLRVLLPGSEPAGVAPDGAVMADCDVAAASRSGSVTPGAVFRPGPGATGCFPAGDGFGLLTMPDSAGGTDVVAVDGRALFTNERLADAGNAALGIGLLGRHPSLVWYVPGLEDAAGGAAPSLGDLTPAWVSPAIVLLIFAAVAAAIWRGRRFGPLVFERLPVTVRARETTDGRARLYARSRDTVHAADQLRIGTAARLGRMLGLGQSAAATTIADAAAERVGASSAVVRGILFDELPSTDAELVALSDRLRDLEAAVLRAVRPERTRP